MKKIIVIAALVSVVFASCKKEEIAAPSTQTEKVMGGEKKDMGGWD
ncbi:MAG: hypothetical protein ACO1NU_00125 [Arcticibacter sp.]